MAHGPLEQIQPQIIWIVDGHGLFCCAHPARRRRGNKIKLFSYLCEKINIVFRL